MHKNKNKFIYLLLFIFCNISVFSADRYFVGEGDWNDTGRWSTTDGGGTGETVPGSGDIVYFTSNSGTCDVNAVVNVSGINIAAGYICTITQNANAITIGTISWVQAGGVFIGGNASIDFNNGATFTGGSFLSTSGTLTSYIGDWVSNTGSPTFNANGGIVYFKTPYNLNLNITTGSFIFNDVIIKGNANAGDITVSGTISVNGDLLIGSWEYSGVQLNGGGISLKGDLTMAPDAANGEMQGGTANITLDGTMDQTITGVTGSDVGRFPSISINKASGALNLVDEIIVGKNWTWITAGSLNAGTSTLYFYVPYSGTSSPVSATIVAGSEMYNNIKVSQSALGFLSISDTLKIAGSFNRFNRSFTSGQIINGNIELYGDLTITDSDLAAGTTLFTLLGTADQSVSLPTGDLPGSVLTINKPSGTVTLTATADLNLAGQDLVIIDGTLDFAGYNFSVADTFTVYDELKLKGSETITTGTTTISATSSTVTYYDSAVTGVVTNLSQTFYSLTFGASKIHEFATGGGNGITVNGTLGSNGSLASPSALRSVGDAAVDWELSLEGTSTLADKVTVKRSDASGGTFDVLATGSYDYGSNTSWVGLIAIPNYTWLGGTGDWNTGGNWQGGAVPGSGNVAKFTSITGTSCNIDTAVNVAGFDIQSTYAGTISQNANTITVGSSDWRQTGGAFVGSSSSITINGELLATGGSFTSTSGTLTITSSLNGTVLDLRNVDTFDANGGIFTFTSGNHFTTYTGSAALNDVIINKCVSCQWNGISTINGELTLTNFGNFAATVYLAGDLSGVGGNDGGSGALVFNGTSDQNITYTGGLGSFTIDKASGTLNFLSDFSINRHLTYTKGLTNGGTSTVTFDGNNHFTMDPGSIDFYNVNLAKTTGSTMTFNSDLNVSNDLNISGLGSIGGSTIYVGGDIVSTDTAISGSGNLVLNGTGAQNMDFSAGDYSNGTVTIDKSSGTVSLTGNFITVGGGTDFIIANGTLDLAGFDFTVQDVFTVYDGLRLKGSETISTSTTTISATSSTVTYYDSTVIGVVTNLSQAFYSLIFGAGKIHEFATGGGNGITVNGTLDSNGTLANPSALRSVGDAAIDWELSLEGNSTLADKVTVKRSNASGGTYAVLATGSIDYGNNTNWVGLIVIPDYTWLGGDGNWNTGGNWQGGAVPGSGNVAIFSSISATNCTIDAVVNVQGFDIQATYSGTISQNANAIAVGSSHWTQAGGGFAGGSATITTDGSFILSGGIFTSTSGTLSANAVFTISGGTFNHNSGKVIWGKDSNQTITTNGVSFYNIDLLKTGGGVGTITFADDFTIVGSLTIDKTDDSSLYMYPSGTRIITLNGTFSIAKTNTSANMHFGNGANLTLKMTDTGTQTMSQTGGEFRATLDIDTTGTVQLSTDFEFGGSWTRTAGTLDQNGNKIIFGNILSGSLTTNGLTFNGDVEFIKSKGSFSTLTIVDDFTIAGTLSVDKTTGNSNYVYPSGTRVITLNGNFSLAETNITANMYFGDGANLTLKMTDAGTQTMSYTGGDFRASLDIDTAGGVQLITDFNFGGSWTRTSGTLDQNGNKIIFGNILNSSLTTNGLTFNGDVDFIKSVGSFSTLTLVDDFTIGGNLRVDKTTGNSNYIYPSGTRVITLNGNFSIAETVLAANMYFGNGPNLTLKMSGGGTQTMSSTGGRFDAAFDIDTAGTVQLITDFDFPSNFIRTTGAFDHNSYTAIFSAIANSTITSNGLIFGDVSFIKGDIGLGSALTLIDDFATAGNLTVDNQDSGSTFTISPSGTRIINVKGNFSIAQTNATLNFGSTSLTLTMTGTNAQTLTRTGGNFNTHLSVNKSSGTASLASAFLVNVANADAIVVSGTLDLAGFDLTVNDVFTVYDGLKLKGSETITVNGATTSADANANFTLSATNSTVTYYDAAVTATITNLAKTFYGLYFGADKYHEIATGGSNGITIEGTLGSNATSTTRSILRSVGDAAVDWELTLNGTSTLADKVMVKRSDASSGTAVLATGSLDNGNNTNWVGLVSIPNFTWLGGDGDWNTPGNWQGGSVPGSGNVAYFTSVSGTSCNIDATVNIQGFFIQSGYAGTITQNAFVIDVGSSNWIQAGGAFVGGTLEIDINGDMDISGGTFLSTSGNLKLNGSGTLASAVFTHNGGTFEVESGGSVIMDFNTNAFNAFIVDKGSSPTVTLISDLIVEGLFTIKGASALSGSTIFVRGNTDLQDTDLGGATGITFDGTGAQSITATVSDSMMPSMKVNKAGGTLTFLSDVRVGFDFEYVTGTMDQGVYYYTAGEASTGTNKTITSGSYKFTNFRMDSGSSNTTTLVGDLTITGTCDILSQNNISGADLILQGTIISVDASIGGTGNTIINGSTDQIVSGSKLPGNITINKSSGNVILSANWAPTMAGKDLSVVNGNLDLAGFDLTVANVFTVYDQLRLKGTETITTTTTTLSATSSTVTYYDSAVTGIITALSQNFYNLTLGKDKIHEIATGGGNGIQINGTFDSVGSVASPSVLRSVADAGIDWELNLQGTSNLTEKVQVKRSNAAAGNAVNAYGSVDNGNNSNWVFIPTFTWLGSTDSNWSTGSNWQGGTAPGDGDPAYFTTPGTRDVNLDVAGIDLASITISTTYPGTITLDNDLEVTGLFNMSGATFDLNSKTLILNDSFIHTGGTFNQINGTVFMNGSGAHTITSSAGTRFYDLKLNDGLVGYWNFNSTSGVVTLDSSGYTRNGTLTNMSDPGDWTSAATTTKFTNSKALTFDGIDGHVLTNDFSYGPDFTISFWFKTTNLSGSFYQYMFSHGTADAANSVNVFFGESSSGISGILRTTIKDTNDSTSYIDVPAGFGDNNWHLYTLTAKSGTGAIVYVDGIRKASNNNGGDSFNPTTNIFMGGREDLNSDRFFPGSMDDVRIYNYALSYGEVSGLGVGNQSGSNVGTYTLAGSALNVDGDFSLFSGTLDISSSNYAINLNGSWLNYGGVFTPQSGTVNLTGTSSGKALLSGGQAFNNLIVNGSGGVWTLADILDVDGTLTITAGELDVEDVNNASTDYTIFAGTIIDTAAGGTLDTHEGTLVINGTSSQSLTLGGSINNLHIEDPSTNGLIGHWKFDEGTGDAVKDISGNNNHGTLKSGAHWTNDLNSTTKYINSHGIGLDGSNDYIDFGDVDAIDGATELTVAMWVKIDDLGADGTLMAKNSFTSGEALLFWRDDSCSNSGRTDTFTILVSGAAEVRIEGATNASNDNGWHHVAFTYKGNDANGLRLYIDGVEDANSPLSTTTATSLKSTSNALYIGKPLVTASKELDGGVDDVRIYSRELSSTEIASLAAGKYADGATSSATFTLGEALDINGNLDIHSGILDVSGSNHAITISEDWSNYVGISGFVDQAGTVTFDGTTQLLNGSTTFFNFTFADLVSDNTDVSLTIEATSVTRIDGTLNLIGLGANDQVNLLSSNPGEKWALNLQGSVGTINLLDVIYSDASTGNTVNAIGSNDSGNNLNWTFVEANFTWLGGDGDWNTGVNWQGGAVPGSSDVAIFSTVSATNCNIDATVNVQGFDIHASYNGTISQNSNVITVGASHWSQVGGGFIGSSTGSDITMNGTFTLSGGIYVSTAGTLDVDAVAVSGGTFNHNAGTFKISSNNLTHSLNNIILQNLTLQSGNHLSYIDFSGHNVVVMGNILHASGQMRNANISLKGNLVNTNGDSRSTAIVTVNGTSAQSIGGVPSSTPYSGMALVINSTGDVSFSDNVNVQYWTFTAANSFAHNNNFLDLEGNAVTSASGGSGVIYYDVNVNQNNPAASHDLNGDWTIVNEFRMKGVSEINGANKVVCKNFVLDDTTSRSQEGLVEITGDFTIANENCTAGDTLGITMNGTGVQNIYTGGYTMPKGSFIINKSSGTVTLQGVYVGQAAENLIVLDGVLDLAGFDVTVLNNFEIYDGLTLKGSETIMVNGTTDNADNNAKFTLASTSSTVTFYDNGNTANVNDLADTFFSLSFGAGKIHEFGTGATNRITVAGTLASNGTSASRSVLRTVGDAAVDWQLNLTGAGTSTLADKVSVKRSDASFGTAILATNSLDLGNNTNWVGLSLPSILSIISTSSNGSYKAGDLINITLSFSEAITMVGTMGVTLDTGSVVVFNSFNNATFAQAVYTVLAGETSADLAAIAVVLSGAATNSVSQNLLVALPVTVISNVSDIVVDTTAPFINAILSSTIDGAYSIGSNINVRLNFSESVTLTGTMGVNLDSGGSVVFTAFSGTTTTGVYTVSAGQTSSDLSVTVITVSGTNTDLAGNALSTALPGTNINTASNIVIDTTAATVTSVQSFTNSGSFTTGGTISVIVNFSESVTLAGGNLIVVLNSGGTVTIVPFVGTTSTGVYSVLATQNANPLLATGLSLSAGTLVDPGSNAVSLASLPATNISPSKTIIIDTVAPTITGGSIGAANVFIDVTFSEPVYTTNGGTGGLNASDYNLVFAANGGNATGVTISNVTTTAGATTSGGETTLRLVLNVTGAVSGTETITVTPNTNQIYDFVGQPALITTTTGAILLLDLLSPSVVSLTGVTVDGLYNTGDIIQVKVTFSEAVLITGSPQLLFETGTTDRNATYISGSGSIDIIFNYTVQAGDNSLDLDAVTTTSLTLNGGTIRDAVANNASLVLPTPGAVNSLSINSALVIDGISPSITTGVLGTGNTYVDVTFTEGIYTTNGAGPITAAGFSVTFNQNGGIATGVTITGVQKTDGSPLAGGETIVRVLIQVTGAALGIETVDIVGVPSSASDLAGNPSAASSTGFLTLVTQGTVPTVLSVTAINPDGIYGVNRLITIEVKFSESVFVTGIPYIELETGDTNKFAIYGGGSGTDTLTFNYIIREGDVASDLDYVSASAFASAIGLVKSSLGIPASSTLVDPGVSGSLGASNNIRIETLLPLISGVQTTANNGTFGIGAVIQLEINFSREVTLSGGNLIITLNSGVDLIVGHLVGNVIKLDYVVEVGEQSDDLGITSITLEGSATLLDSKGVANNMTLPVPLFIDEHAIIIEALSADFLITATANSGGNISPVGATPINAGADQTFTITPDVGFHVDKIIVDSVEVAIVSAYIFSNVNKDHMIEIVFIEDQVAYTIVANSGFGGSVSPAGATIVDVGNDLVINITPEIGYHISDVLVDGVSQGAISSHTFSSVNANHTFEADFSIDKLSYIITVNTIGSGTINPSGNVSVDHGFDQLFSFTPNSGFHIGDVKFDGVSVGALSSFIFSTVLSNHTLTVDFVKVELNYVIVSSVSVGGSVSPSGSNTVAAGASQIYEFAAETGYHLVDVLIDGVSQGAKSSIVLTNIQKETQVEGVFAKDQDSYLILLNIPFEKSQTTVTFEKSGETIDLTSTGTASLLENESGDIIIVMKDGFHLVDVKLNGVSLGAVKLFTLNNIKSDQLIDVILEKDQTEYLITTSIVGQGNISPSEKISVKSGADQGLIISPLENHHIQDVIVDGISQGPVSTLFFEAVVSNHQLTIIFTEDQETYTIGSSVVGKGSISPLGVSSVDAGDSLAFSILADAKHQLIELIINGRSKTILSPRSYSFFNVQSNQSIIAIFGLMQEVYKVNVVHNSGGSTSQVGDINVLHGDNFSLTINAAAGFHVKAVVLDGKSLGPMTTILLNTVIADHNVDVTFEADAEVYTINAISSLNGSLSPTGIATASVGNSHLVTISPDTGFRVLNVIVDGIFKGPQSSYLFTHINTNHEIKAVFVEEEKSLTIVTRTNGVGTVSPEGFAGVEVGGTLFITISTDSNNQIVDVIIDGVSQGAIESYIFSNITENHLVDVFFENIDSDIKESNNNASSSSGGCTYNRSADYSNLWSLLLLIFFTFTFVRLTKK
ncbi:MAG: hypothetical protein COA79_08200 [Planctomycetota bacterium]|nr:MAG: hypothetical protein COA79_08200 [Planctomycetota bacterium]